MTALIPVTPPFDLLLGLVSDSARSPHTKRAYRAAITDFLLWCQSSEGAQFSKATVQQYRATLEESGLSAAGVQIRIAAIRRLAAEMADNHLLDPQTALAIAKARGPRRHGVRTGNWLDLHQAEDMLALPDTSRLKGQRDRALLSILLGAGLRRSEISALRFEHLQQREGRWVIADLIGKHDRIRTIPVPGWCKAAIDAWAVGANLTAGYVFRPLNRAGRVIGERPSAPSVYYLVTSYGVRLGTRLTPHDCRRSFAKLAHQGRAALEQIQLSLGQWIPAFGMMPGSFSGPGHRYR
jgi:site-specific recombinase XerC